MYLYLSRHNNTIKKKAIEKLFVLRKVSDKGKTLNPNTLFFCKLLQYDWCAFLRL